MAVLAAVGDGRIRRGIEFLRVERIRIVEAHAPGDIQPREDVVAGRKRQHITLLVRVAQVAVVDPVGILHAQVTAFHVRTPELLHEFRPFVVTLEATVKVKILAPRKQVGRNQRVRINALVGHVLVFLIDIAGAGVEPQFIFQKVRGVAESKVVAIVFVVGDDAVGIDRCGGKIGLVLVRTAGNGHGVGVHVSRFEIVVRRITVAGRREQLLAPAVNPRAAAGAVQARAVAILELGQHERVQEFRIARKRNLQRSSLSLLRRNHHGSVRGFRTVESRSCGARQHRHRLDILGIDVGDGLRRTARIELRSAATAEIIHRDTVDNVKRVRRLRNGFVTAQNHLRCTADSRRRGVDRDTCNLTRQRVDEVGVLDGRDVFGLDLLYVVGYGFFRTFNTKSSDHDLFDLGGRLLKRKVESSTVTHIDHQSLIAQIADFQLPGGSGGGYLKRERAIGTAADAD